LVMCQSLFMTSQMCVRVHIAGRSYYTGAGDLTDYCTKSTWSPDSLRLEKVATFKF